MKPGEIEAKLILEHLGISFDSSYYDRNLGHSMADLKTTNGRYIEVTHTNHNKQIVISGNEFSKMSVSERISKMEDAHAAYIRLQQKDYYQFKGKNPDNHFGQRYNGGKRKQQLVFAF